MAVQVQQRRGTTTEHSTFTGAVAEITVDTTKKTAVVHDGSTAGGFALARESAIIGAALIDAKGDLLVGSANDAVARLAVGADGYVLTADASQTLGLKWAQASSAGNNLYLYNNCI